ncbi:MAG: hypothetical protein JXR53_00200 [Bacteroidales bacterium]|nr:hypothetical protein [Bacteroidales bacterium]
MKRQIFLLISAKIFALLIFVNIANINAQQVALYNHSGFPEAYIDFDNEATVFLWDGTPVAFLHREYNDLMVIGFNSSYLGWYENGILYSYECEILGCKRDVLDIPYKDCPRKGKQKRVPEKPDLIPIYPIKNILKTTWCETNLSDYIKQGLE